MTFITAGRAKGEYGLSEADLAGLHCELCRNPHYRRAAPMRLYSLDDVLDVADEKAERALYLEEHRDELLAEAKEQRQQAQVEARATAREFVDCYDPSTVTEPVPTRNQMPLPADVLGVVLAKVAGMYEPRGIRGPGVVVLDLLNAALACKDLYAAARDGFAALAAMLPPVPAGMDAIVRDPKAAKVATLQAVLRPLGWVLGGTKVELQARVLLGLGVTRRPAPWVPAAVLYAVRCERHRRRVGEIGITPRKFESDAANEIVRRMRDADSLRAARIIAVERWPNVAAYDAEMPAQQPKPERRAVRPPAQHPTERMCSGGCTNTPSPTCANGCCAHCCRRRPTECHRHSHFPRALE